MRRFITLMVWAMVLLAIGFSSPTAKAYDKPAKMYLYGNINDIPNKWDNLAESDMVPMTDIGNNTWKVKITSTTEAYFRVCAIPSTGDWYFGAPRNDKSDVKLTATSKDVLTWNKTTSGEGKAFSFGSTFGAEYNLYGKYIYITWKDDNTGCFTVSVVEEPANIWIFGNVGNTTTWVDKETDYKLSKTSTENNKPVYTGKITLRNGQNWFRFWDGANESGPNKGSSDSDEPISLNTTFTTYDKHDKAFYINSDSQKECDVNLVFNGQQSYTVTISEPQTDEYLYVYSTDNYVAPAVTLKKGTDGHYTKILNADEIKEAFPGKRTYYLFVSDENINGTEWNSFAGHMWTPKGGNKDVANGTAIDMEKEDNGAFVWNYQHDLTNLSFDVVLGTTPSFTMSTTFDDSANIYLFGDLGYTTTGWSDDKASQCILTQTGTKKIENVSDPVPVYTGKIKLKEGDNYFRIYGDNKELRPSTFNDGSDNYLVTLGTEFNANTEKGTDDGYKSWKYTASKAVELNVELVRKGAADYVVTIMPYGGVTTLYVYDETNLQVYATLTSDGDGIFSGEAPYDNYTQHSLFITDKEIKNAPSMQSFKNRWTTDNKDGIQLTNNDALTAISKNTTGGVMKWTLTDKNVSAVKMTADIKNGTFTITTTTSTAEYYLSGDINDWATKNDNEAKLRTYRFAPVNTDTGSKDREALTGETDLSKWYVLYVPRMHGQFKIHQGNWTDKNCWGCDWTRTTEGVQPYDNMDYDKNKDEISLYIANSTAAENINGIDGINGDYNMTSGDKSYFNLRCAHNYYNDAYIYFNPEANKLFIEGTAEDLYVYYYNGEEKDGTATIYIKENAVNENTDHYYYDYTLLNTPMTPGVLTTEERQIPALSNVPDGAKCYKAQVPAGLEEKYTANNKDHYFEFYLAEKGTTGSYTPITDKEVFNGQNVYYIYTGTLPAVLFNYKDAEGTEVTSNTEGYEICYRLVAINESGVPEYIKEDGTRTAKRSEAAKYTFNLTLTTSDGVTPESGKVGTNWLAVKKTTNSNSIMAKAAPAWTSQVEPVKAGDVNRYVEFDVTLTDPDDATKAKVYHEFHSDFELAADNDKDSYVQDGELDLKAQMTGKLLPGRDTNPQYKLNGTDLYAMAETSVPTAVEEIPVDNEYDNDANAETVYYNLQGVRVNNPDRGIYIMVKGKTSKKVRF